MRCAAGRRAGPDLRAPLRRPAGDRRPGHDRAGDAARSSRDLDTLVIAVGGGGLISGIATAVRALKPGVRDRRRADQRASRPWSTPSRARRTRRARSTIAEGIAVGAAGQITRERSCASWWTTWCWSTKATSSRRCVMLLEIEKTVVEGAGAAGLAALLKDPARYAGRKVGLVLCGGNIDPLLLAAIIERGMVRAGRLARIRVGARDTPGVLARITALVAEAGANIDEVHHQRAFSHAVGAERRGRTGAADAQPGACARGGGAAAGGGLRRQRRTDGAGAVAVSLRASSAVLHSRPCASRPTFLRTFGSRTAPAAGEASA